METKNVDLLSTKSAALRLCLSPQTLEKWRSQKRGPRFVKLENKAIRYRPTDLDTFLEEGGNDGR